MATWKEQLSEISDLREERRKNDDALYTVQIKLRKANELLQKIKKEETALPADRAAVEDLREKIAELENEIRRLNGELDDLAGMSEKLQLNESRIAFLQKKLSSLDAQLSVLEESLSEAENEQPRDEASIENLKNQIERLKQVKTKLEKELEELRQKRAALERQRQAAAERKSEIEAQKNRLQEQINDLTERLNTALAPERRNPPDEGLEGEYEEAKQKLLETTRKLHDAVSGLYIDPHPARLVPNLNDGIPFLLMPVRIETRFINTEKSDELWVRIYPDDIAVHTHEKVLTDKEVSEGKKYWTELFNAEKTGGADLEQNKKSAWSYLANQFRSQRAAWIAQATKPLNWGQAGINEPDQLDFPKHDLTKTESWSRAPRTQMMPDRFVVMLYQGDKIVHEAVGKIIPDELPLGPDPMEEEDAFVERDDKLQFGDSFNWASDFPRAVELGMGFRIPISKVQAARGFSKVLVLGLYLSSDENETKTGIETLIDNHHYSPKGFSLVKQGAPTNNTDESGSGFTRNDAFNEIGYFTETGDPLFEEGDKSDGCNLAEALGIGYEALQYVLNSEGRDHREAVAMNTALYPGTLGYYFDTMLHPVLSETDQDKLREFFTRHVCGRGTVPAVRVGNQPYGILLTSDFSRWKWSERDRIFGLPFLNGLYTTLQKYHAIWLDLLNDVAFTGKPGSEKDPAATLMNILGLQPGSVSFYQRVAYSTDYLNTLDAFQYGGRYYNDMAKNFTSKLDVLRFLKTLGYTGDVPQLLHLVYHHRQTLLDAANLIDNVPLSEKDGIRFYDADAEKNYLHWLAEAVSISALESQDFGGKPVPNALLYLNLRRALLLQLHKASVKWLDRNNIDVKDTLKPANFHNILVQPTLTKWETMKAKVQVAEPNHIHKNLMISEYLLSRGRDEEEAAFLNEVKTALAELANVPTARLERCFAEHIDTCTYRLDSWTTGLFDIRLQNLRSDIIEGKKVRKQGIYLGAFGWVENLKPATRKIVTENIPEKLTPKNGAPLFEYDDNNGLVHAPSLNQASAAAVLRSGYVSHAKSEEPEVMAVNLSSERVRRALFILQGIRNGQQIEALLGYQFERALHDAASADENLIKLNEYIYDFRDKFPLELHYIRQQGTNLPMEAIPANNVVNGLRLSEAAGDTPYGAAGNVAGASEPEKNVIRREKDKLSDTLDAVKDLLLCESVYQIVQGNFDRSGAVINALKDANVPPEIDVIQTPRGSQMTFTNRVTVQFDPDAGNPWFPVPMTARASMEPGLNKWLAEILGDGDKLFFRAAHLDDDGNEIDAEEASVDNLQLQPIDLVYIIGSELNTGAPQSGQENRTAASELEVRIAYWYRTLKGLDKTVPVRIEFMKPADKRTLGKFLPLLLALKSLVTDSRFLNAQDFDPPSKESLENESNPKGYVLAELENRIGQRLIVFQNDLSALQGLSIDASVPDEDGNEQHYFTLETAFEALKSVNLDWPDIIYVFETADALILKDKLFAISRSGVDGSFPATHTHTGDDDKLALLGQAMAVARRMKEIADKATASIAEAAALTETEQKVEKLIAAGKALLGDLFTIMPRFTYNNEADILLSHANRSQLLKYASADLEMEYPAEEWMQNVAHVRPKLRRWDHILSLYECFHGERLSLQPVQIPHRARDSWLAVEFPEKDPDDPTQPFTINHDTLSVTIHGEAAFKPASYQCGLLLDDWPEPVPLKNEITGIGFHYNQPSAAPPQALLLAVTPEEKGHWTWDELVGILNDTLLRAKLRAVEPDLLDKVNKAEVGVLLPAILSDFSQFDLNIALDYRLNLEYVAENNPIVVAGIIDT